MSEAVSGLGRTRFAAKQKALFARTELSWFQDRLGRKCEARTIGGGYGTEVSRSARLVRGTWWRTAVSNGLMILSARSTMRAALLTMLSFAGVSSCWAQRPYTEDQVIEYAKSLDIATLDPSLTAQHLEEWLRSGPPQVQVLRWTVADTCDLKPFDSDSGSDYPLCAKIWLRRGNVEGFFLVQVGTLRRGIEGHPRLYQGIDLWAQGWVRGGGAERLSQLAAALNETEKPAVP
jgi:hypothetical protein